MQLRVAFFLPSLEGGGAEKNTINILKELSQKDYKISLVLAKKKGIFLNEVPKGIEIVDFGSNNLFLIFLKNIFYIKKHRPDIFISTFPRFNLLNILANLFAGSKTRIIIIEQTTPSILHLTTRKITHKLIGYFFLPWLIRMFYPKATSIITVSEAVRDDLKKIIKRDIKIEIIYNPVVDEKILEKSKEIVDEKIFISNLPIILTAGRLVDAKDYTTIIKAFANILRVKEANLVILGEGEEEKNIKNLISKLGIEDRVYFLGFKDNPYKYFSKSSVFLSASKREGFSNSIVEAMFCGVPVVATDAAGPKEIIENGKNGILAKIGNSEELSEKIIYLLNNPDVAKKIAEEAKKRSLDFTIESSVKKYENVFQKSYK